MSGMLSAGAPVEIDEMTIADYEDVLSLLRASPGVAIRGADSREATERYLVRNPELSFVARCAKRLVGCVMCGHDGRRCYLQHLAVDPSYRRRGIGTELVGRCLRSLNAWGSIKHTSTFWPPTHWLISSGQAGGGRGGTKSYAFRSRIRRIRTPEPSAANVT